MRAPGAFRFSKQFPKCTAWITRQSKVAFWFAIEGGVLSARRGKAAMNKPAAAKHKTLKYTTLHEMFTDMETRL